MSVFVVGVTGGIGSGKTTVADRFAARGVVVVDTDAIAHELTGPSGAAMPAIASAFGAGVLRPDGALDRGAMRRLVFADADIKGRLEAILHPLIRSEGDRRCREAASPYVLLVVPLLVESGTYRRRVDRVLVVDCPEETQIARVMARSGLAADEVRRIMSAQASRGERLAVADDVIANDRSPAALDAEVDRLHALYLQLVADKAAARAG